MAITCTRHTDAFAAAVHGVHIAAGVSEADFADMISLFNDYFVLVFHQQDIVDEQQIVFSCCFGLLESTVLTNARGGRRLL